MKYMYQFLFCSFLFFFFSLFSFLFLISLISWKFVVSVLLDIKLHLNNFISVFVCESKINVYMFWFIYFFYIYTSCCHVHYYICTMLYFISFIWYEKRIPQYLRFLFHTWGDPRICLYAKAYQRIHVTYTLKNIHMCIFTLLMHIKLFRHNMCSFILCITIS